MSKYLGGIYCMSDITLNTLTHNNPHDPQWGREITYVPGIN